MKPIGPLRGVRMLEIASIGPGPFCAMVLSDLGAEVIRIDRLDRVPPEGEATTNNDVLARGRRSIAVDLKKPEGVELVLKMAEKADALIEGFRPGVMERLGLGPDVVTARNPRIVYGRMTGWGQTGPLAHAAGHDINYIALTGALHHIGRRGGPPVPPLNLVGDFGGGGMLLALGVVAALFEREASGKGQVVDAAMVDGASLLMAGFHAGIQTGRLNDERGTNLVDSGAPFYDAYECADGKYVAVGAIEPQFYRELLERVGIDPQQLPDQMDQSRWPQMKETMAAVFKTKTRDEWASLLEGTDACFAPVLSIREAYEHPHNRARSTFIEVGGITQPAPAPRFSRTPGQVQRPPAVPGEHTEEVLREWGFAANDVAELRQAQVIN